MNLVTHQIILSIRRGRKLKRSCAWVQSGPAASFKKFTFKKSTSTSGAYRDDYRRLLDAPFSFSGQKGLARTCLSDSRTGYRTYEESTAQAGSG